MYFFMPLFKQTSLTLDCINLQVECTYIYLPWPMRSYRYSLMLLFPGVATNFPGLLRNLELCFCSLQPPGAPPCCSLWWVSPGRSRFITDSLGSLGIRGPVNLPASQLPKPRPLSGSRCPLQLSDHITVALNCQRLPVFPFLCERSSACGSLCTNCLFNTPPICQRVYLCTVLSFSAGADVPKNPYCSNPSWARSPPPTPILIFLCKLLLTQQILTLLPSILLSTKDWLTPWEQMFYLQSPAGFSLFFSCSCLHSSDVRLKGTLCASPSVSLKAESGR